MGDSHPSPHDTLAAVLIRDRRSLLGFVRSRLGNSIQDHDAEDVLSDVVLGLLERADLMAGIENLSAYLITALANRVRDLFRRKREVPLDDSPTHEPAIPAAAEQRLELTRALSLLTTAERAVWVAVELDGRSFRDLAEHWGVPLGTLLSRKNRAEKRLRASLDAPSP